jgi:phosphoribosyl 1,2-cyclic phosphodiesterase
MEPPSLCVLASGSSGNCSVLRTPGSAILIDAGLSPRRTRLLLEELGLGIESLGGILLTHLDSDHFHNGWGRALPESVPVHLHHSHVRQARSRGLGPRSCVGFGEVAEIAGDFRVFASLNAHDELGTASFRFEFTTGASLGFATDIGSVSDALIEHLGGVDVLAVESNYCPRMQIESDRPAFLKQRVMGGSGHLSNQECARLVAQVRPRGHVVLLHLSRQCNDPALAARAHARQPYRLTVTSQFEPTPWIEIVAGGASSVATVAPRAVVRGSLFDHMVVGPTEPPR